MKIIKVMNLFCAKEQHEKCMGIIKGTDRITFVCTCKCHIVTNLPNDRNKEKN